MAIEGIGGNGGTIKNQETSEAHWWASDNMEDIKDGG